MLANTSIAVVPELIKCVMCHMCEGPLDIINGSIINYTDIRLYSFSPWLIDHARLGGGRHKANG